MNTLPHSQNFFLSVASKKLNTNPLLVCLLPRLPPAADSFDYKKFFKACGLASKSADDVKKAFAIIDQDNSGFIEEEELK